MPLWPVLVMDQHYQSQCIPPMNNIRWSVPFYAVCSTACHQFKDTASPTQESHSCMQTLYRIDGSNLMSWHMMRPMISSQWGCISPGVLCRASNLLRCNSHSTVGNRIMRMMHSMNGNSCCVQTCTILMQAARHADGWADMCTACTSAADVLPTRPAKLTTAIPCTSAPALQAMRSFPVAHTLLLVRIIHLARSASRIRILRTAASQVAATLRHDRAGASCLQHGQGMLPLYYKSLKCGQQWRPGLW